MIKRVGKVNPCSVCCQRDSGVNRYSDAWSKLHAYRPVQWNKQSAIFFYEIWKRSLPVDFPEPSVDPDFSSWFAFFKWGWEYHNESNAKLGKPSLNLNDALIEHQNYVLFEQPKILCELPEPRSSQALITVAPDKNTQNELKFTRKAMQEYAERYFLDYIEITALTPQKHLCGNKYAYSEVAKRYGHSLWLDTDVVIMPDAPNIFDQVDCGQWALCDDLPGLKQIDNSFEWFNNEWMHQSSALGLPAYEVPCAWNSGVVVAPQDAFKWYHPPSVPVPNVWCAEQHYHTRCLLDGKADVLNLDRKWNVGYWDPTFPDYVESGYFIHIGGCKPLELRLRYLEHFSSGRRDLPKELLPTDNKHWMPGWVSRFLTQ